MADQFPQQTITIYDVPAPRIWNKNTISPPKTDRKSITRPNSPCNARKSKFLSTKNLPTEKNSSPNSSKEKKKTLTKKQKNPNDSGFFFIGDGIIDNLFHFLWMKDVVFGGLTNVNIPDTIIWQMNEPVKWYFSSRGNVKKKLKAKLTNNVIKETFLKNKNKCNVIAVFIHKTN